METYAPPLDSSPRHLLIVLLALRNLPFGMCPTHRKPLLEWVEEIAVHLVALETKAGPLHCNNEGVLAAGFNNRNI